MDSEEIPGGELELDVDDGCPACKSMHMSLKIKGADLVEDHSGVVNVTCLDCGHEWAALYEFKT